MQKDQAYYALRRTLPPWNFEKNLKELDLLVKYRVDELIVKVDTEEFSHGQLPLDFLRAYQPKLFAIKERLNKLGIGYSLNPWITQGHVDRGRHAALTHPGMQTMVDWNGQQSTACACPLCEVWQKNTSEAWKLYAQTEPLVIWAEDDIRSFNHGAAREGCFCPLHMARFSQLTGCQVSREELVKALCQPGNPHPWRELYLSMQRQIMIETAAMLGTTVHRYSPETSLGLMSSGPRSHTREGRCWKEFAEALADGKTLYSRPPTGVYQEFSLRDNYWGSDTILLTRKLLPEHTVEYSEIDNFSFTRFAKSSTFTFLQMATSFAFGCKGVTLNLYDHAGTPMAERPEMGRLMRSKKAFFNQLADFAAGPGRYRGVQMLFSENYASTAHLVPGERLPGLEDPAGTATARFNYHGIPVVYDQERCCAAIGQAIRCCSDDTLRTMLDEGHGLLLDAEAAQVLFERGFGELIGLQQVGPLLPLTKAGIFSAEEFYNPEFGGARHKFMNLFVSGHEGLRFCQMKFASETREISRLLGPDLEVLSPGFVAFENRLGARVVLSTQTLNEAGMIFNNEFRREQLEHIFDYLSAGKFPVRVHGDGVYPLLFRKDCPDWLIAGFFNLSLDVWRHACLLLEVQPDEDFAAAELLLPNGRLRNLEMQRQGSRMNIPVPGTVSIDRPAIVRLRRKKNLLA